ILPTHGELALLRLSTLAAANSLRPPRAGIALAAIRSRCESIPLPAAHRGWRVVGQPTAFADCSGGGLARRTTGGGDRLLALGRPGQQQHVRVEGEGGGEERAGNAASGPCQYRDSISRFCSVFAGFSRRDLVAKCLVRLVGVRGFEPPAPASRRPRAKAI